MKSELENEELFKRFVLGGLPEPLHAELEDRFLAHDDVYQDLLIAEDDLIDAYVRAELPAPERALFEQRCLSSEPLRRRVEFARSLFKLVSRQAAAESAPRPSMSWWRSLAGAFTTRRPVLGFAFAAAFLVIVLGGWWLFTDKRRSHPEPEQAKAVQPTPLTALESPAVAPAAEEELARNQERPPVRETRKGSAPVIATFTLGPGLVRGGNGPGALVLPAAATEVRLRLTLEGEDYRKYLAVLSTPEGRKVWSRELTKGPATTSALLTLNIPADLLKNGDYVLDVSGAHAAGKRESVADYSFRVVKK